MKKIITTLLLSIQIVLSYSQDNIQPITIKASVLAEDTKNILPFANIFNKNISIGTASNLEGYFELPNNRIGDTILITYLGYEDKLLVVSPNMPKKIGLSSLPSLLGEVVVIADSDYLYDIILKIRKNKGSKTKTSKTYFFLETLLYDEPIEVIESYYNGEYSNLGIDHLSIKKGRIGLKPINNRYFRSTESSRLFSLHNLFAKSKLFPDNPLSLKKKDLKRDYSLKISNSFTENLSKIMVIDFIPKNNKNELFNGSIWIDQKANRLIKIILNIQNSSIHPFVPIGFNTIHVVDMEITKSYETIDDQQYINSIDFNYNVFYSDNWGNEVKAVTRAFTKAYNYENKFNLPNFEFTRHLHGDYRNITVVPYDSVFWNLTSEFRFYDRVQEIERFIMKYKIDNRFIHPENKSDSNLSQLQFPYFLWSKNRFYMRQAPASVIEKSKNTKAFEIDRFHLSVKLYLDVNIVQDSIIYQVYSILDPVSSYFHFYINDSDRAFMNMYFDLVEIQKDKLVLELDMTQNLSVELIEEIYQKHLKNFDEASKLFVNETGRGRNLKGMEKWNNYIFDSLEINSLRQFNIKAKG
ncbi:MAG: hypothetical protein ACJATA_000153 [Sphingobacteriales bacterium]|jgi:hypothetical protein